MVKIIPTANIHYENWVKKYVQRHNHRVSHEKYQFLPFSMVFLNASVEAWPWVQSLGMRVCVRSRPQFPLSSLPSSSVVTAQQEQEGLLQSPGLCPDGTEMPNSFHVPWPLWTHWTGTAFPNSNQIQTRMQQEKKVTLTQRGIQPPPHQTQDNESKKHEIPCIWLLHIPYQHQVFQPLSLLPQTQLFLSYIVRSPSQSSMGTERCLPWEISNLPRECRIHLCMSQFGKCGMALCMPM